jgi:hypothetical protein
VEAGDTAWTLAGDDSADTWKPFRVMAVSNATAGQCALLGPVLSDSARSVARITLTLAPPPGAAAIGAPLRITRPVRYSLYRASDGAWYAGEKDWSNTLGKFNTVQPIAGPFLAAAAGGLLLRYADSAGFALPVPVGERRAIAMIRVELRGQTKAAVRTLSAAAASGKRVDSVIVTVSLHNRR